MRYRFKLVAHADITLDADTAEEAHRRIWAAAMAHDIPWAVQGPSLAETRELAEEIKPPTK